jgi:hypothetical protein
MTRQQMTKQVLKWMPPGRRKKGRPRVRWMKGIHDAVAERLVEDEQWIDREEWRFGIERRLYKKNLCVCVCVCGYTGRMLSAFEFFVMQYRTRIKVLLALFQALPQCMLCINRLRATCWFHYIQPL